jgi:hypothetical protein
MICRKNERLVFQKIKQLHLFFGHANLWLLLGRTIRKVMGGWGGAKIKIVQQES